MRAAVLVAWGSNVDDDHDLDRALAMVDAYHERWQHTRSDWDTISVEMPFEIEFEDVLVTGKIDALKRHKPTGKLYVVERKTTSDDIDNVGTDYWQRLALDIQVTVYQHAAQLLFDEEVAILYDVIRKPLGSPKLQAAIRKRASETEAEYAERKESVRETPDEFHSRLYHTMLEQPDRYLVRREVIRTRDETVLLLAEIHETFAEIENYHGSYPRNDGACHSRYGTCPYLGVCAGIETLDDPKFVRLDAPLPELENRG